MPKSTAGPDAAPELGCEYSALGGSCRRGGRRRRPGGGGIDRLDGEFDRDTDSGVARSRRERGGRGGGQGPRRIEQPTGIRATNGVEDWIWIDGSTATGMDLEMEMGRSSPRVPGVTDVAEHLSRLDDRAIFDPVGIRR